MLKDQNSSAKLTRPVTSPWCKRTTRPCEYKWSSVQKSFNHQIHGHPRCGIHRSRSCGEDTNAQHTTWRSRTHTTLLPGHKAPALSASTGAPFTFAPPIRLCPSPPGVLLDDSICNEERNHQAVICTKDQRIITSLSSGIDIRPYSYAMKSGAQHVAPVRQGRGRHLWWGS